MNHADPDWLSTLAAAVAECLVEAASLPLAAHVQAGVDGLGEPLDEVSFFFGATETVGGAKDGKRTHVPFWVDLAPLVTAFESVEEFSWQATSMGPDDDFGPHIAVEGLFAGRPVRVRVLASSPKQFPAARTAESRRNTVANRW